MSDWRENTARTARHLRSNALAGAVIALLLLLVGGLRCIAPPLSLPILVSGLIAISSAAYLAFDAALFRLAGSFAREDEGLAAIDDTLDRMGLRRRPPEIRPLGDRIRGSRRILLAHRTALAALATLSAFHILGEVARC